MPNSLPPGTDEPGPSCQPGQECAAPDMSRVRRFPTMRDADTTDCNAPICPARGASWPPWTRQCCSRLLKTCPRTARRSEEHTSELQSRGHLVCRLLLE